MTAFPAANHISDNARTEGEVKSDLEDFLAATKQLPGAAAYAELTISSGSVTPTGAYHQIDTESDAASDDLTNIVQTNLPDGSILVITAENTSRVVTVKHAAGGDGQIYLKDAADTDLDNDEKFLVLIRNGSAWLEILRSMTAVSDVTNLSTNIQADGTPTTGMAAVGEIRPFIAVESPPSGWLECDGSAVSRTTYADLFSGQTLSIGTTFGVGDGSTTFNVPDLRGRFLRGWDHGAGTDPDAASRTNRGDGTSGDHVGTKQADEYKTHRHGIAGSTSILSSGSDLFRSGTETTTYSAFSGGNETRPKNIAVMWCIKY